MENINSVNNTQPLYATAIIYYQRKNEDMYEPCEALQKGTIYPSLYMPYTYWRFGK